MNNGIRPEFSLLLCCARTNMDAENQERLKELLRGALDWRLVVKAARLNGMIPLLYWNLYQRAGELVPAEVFAELHDLFLQNSRHNLFLSGVLVKLLRLFESHGIQVVPYKGPLLTDSIYKNLSLRYFGDLDLLVHKEDVLKVKHVLRSAGYHPQLEMSAEEERAFLESQCEYNFFDENERLRLEIHWDFLQKFFNFPLDLRDVWQRVCRTKFAGQDVLTLAIEDLLLLLCVHGAKHLWERIAWICDISEIIRTQNELNWKLIFENARKTGSERMLLLGLHLANDLLGAKLEEALLTKIRSDASVQNIAKEIAKIILSEESLNHPIEEDPLFKPMYLHLRERKLDTIRYCWRVATTPNKEDWKLLKLPGWLFPLYYAVRPFRLSVKYLNKFLGSHTARNVS